MASIVLGVGAMALGKSISGGAGLLSTALGAIGGVAGGLIDSAFVMPALMRKKHNAGGPRIDDLRLQTASEGAPMAYCLGLENRLAGTVIWMSDLIVESSKKRAGGKGAGKVRVYSYSTHVAVAICEGDIHKVYKIWANDKIIYDATGGEGGTPQYDDRYETLTIYHGTLTQDPDPLIQSVQGAENTPAFRGTAYIVIEKLDLGDFGNQLPNFTFLVGAHNTLTVREAIEKILYRYDFDDTDYSVDNVDGTRVLRGMAMAGPQTAARMLEPILLTYDILVRERAGKLIFFDRGSAGDVEVEVDERDLAAHEEGQEVPQTLVLREAPDYTLPGEVNVDYIDPMLNYQTGSQRAKRADIASSVVENFEVPIVLAEADARKMAERLLWQRWAERRPAELTLPQKYLHVEESDKLNVVADGEVYTVRVTQIDEGHNGLLVMRGVAEEVQTLTWDDLPSAEPIPNPRPEPSGPYEAPDLTLSILAIPAMSNDHAAQFGFYIVVTAENGVSYRGGTLFQSVDGGTTYKEYTELPDALATAGVALTELADGSPGAWDNTNTVDVEVANGELTTYPQATVQADATLNRVLIGDEIIAFATATLLGTTGTNGEKQYTLSGLIRGDRNTVNATADHQVGERVILLDPPMLRAVEADRQVAKYKAVAAGRFLADEEVVETTASPVLTHELTRPFPPTQITSTPSSNDRLIEWVPQSRALRDDAFTPIRTPMLEPVVSFHVAIYNWDGVSTPDPDVDTPIREYFNYGGLSATAGWYAYNWSAAEQSSDGHTHNTAFYVAVRQDSRLHGNDDPYLGVLASDWKVQTFAS